MKSNVEPRKFTPGDKLYAKNNSGHGKWIPVTAIQTTGPLSYKVRSQTGHVLRRHVDQLRYRYATENQPRVCRLGKLATTEFTFYSQCGNLVGNSYLNIK